MIQHAWISSWCVEMSQCPKPQPTSKKMTHPQIICHVSSNQYIMCHIVVDESLRAYR